MEANLMQHMISELSWEHTRHEEVVNGLFRLVTYRTSLQMREAALC
jgi:hypothetical protein